MTAKHALAQDALLASCIHMATVKGLRYYSAIGPTLNQ